MYLARVTGQVVATVKPENMTGTKLLLIQPLNPDMTLAGGVQVAIDTAQAGDGDLVTCVGSREAALAHKPSFVPVDAAIVGIVDDVHHQPGAAQKRGGRS